MIKRISVIALAAAMTLSAQANDNKGALVSANAAPTLACYVDTPAYDQFTQGDCAGMIYNGPATTTAVFQVFGTEGGNYSYQWSNCTSNNLQCARSIRAYRPLTVSVTVTNNQTGAQYFLTATAEYERGF